jgi:lipopolysaccharide transport system ATP-binding protein
VTSQEVEFMSDIAIHVEGLGKRYRIGQNPKATKTTRQNQKDNKIIEPTKRFDHTSHNLVEKSASGRESYIWALRNISFDIKKGEVMGLIGPNGAGKSTLLKILSRITHPTTGSVDIYGRVSSLLEVSTGFHRELSGRDNIYFNGSILGLSKREIDRKFDEIIAFAELEQHIQTLVKFYSSGMSIRLGFAIAAHLDPEIFLVDEALAVGDAAFQKKCLAKMESVGQEGRTIIFVSHHLSSITWLCEKAMLLNHGKLIETGLSEDVVAHYLSANLGIDSYRDWMNPAEAPGDDIVRLRSVRVIDEENTTSYSFDIRQPVGVEMTYDVLRPGFELSPIFSLRNAREIVLFSSSDTDDEWRGRPRPEGRYVSIGWIPGNLLAEGDVRINVSMRGHDMKSTRGTNFHFEDVEAVAFQVIESPDGDTARVDNVGRIRGAIRPYMQWTTEYDQIFTEI